MFRDKSIAVCLKPVGIDSENEGMPALLRERLGAKEVYCVHRLDRAVGGLMVYALSRPAAAKLSSAIAEGRLVKEYLCVIPGVPQEREGTMCDLLFHDKAKNKTYVVSRERRGVKRAELEYRVLDTAADMSLVSVLLRTGRSHQIRVQFASRRLPLLGDVKYGSAVRSCPVALFSHRLTLPHPVTGEIMTFEAAPGDSYPWSSFSR